MNDELMRAIGRVTVAFARLEARLSFFTWFLIDPDQRLGQIITAELSFKNLLGLLSSVFRHRMSDEAAVEAFESILNKAIQAEEKRNLIMHSRWLGGSAAGQATRAKTTAKKGKGIRFQFEQMSENDINQIADQLEAVAKEFVDFMVAVIFPSAVGAGEAVGNTG